MQNKCLVRKRNVFELCCGFYKKRDSSKENVARMIYFVIGLHV